MCNCPVGEVIYLSWGRVSVSNGITLSITTSVGVYTYMYVLTGIAHCMAWSSRVCILKGSFHHAPVAATHSTMHLVHTSALHGSSGGCVRRQEHSYLTLHLVENRPNFLACKRWTMIMREEWRWGNLSKCLEPIGCDSDLRSANS